MTKEEALRMALEALEGLWKDGFEGYPAVLHEQAITALREALAEQPARPDKLKVTLEDRPIDIELAQYKRMFEAACSALGQIGDALGCAPEEGGAELILAAIAELKAEQPAQRKPLTDEQIDALTLPPSGTATVRDLVRIIEQAHGIKGEA